MQAHTINHAAGADVIALGSKAARHTPQQQEADVSVLGYLVWFSVSETEVKREDLIRAIEDSGLGGRFAPAEITPRDAFRRATSSLGRTRVPVVAHSTSRLFGDDKRHANLLVRDVRMSGKSLIRQLIREVVDAEGATLAHEAVVQFELSPTEELRVFARHKPLLAAEEEVIEKAGTAFEKAKKNHDSGAVRRTVSRAISECSPVALRASGGVYFVPRSHEPRVRAIERFIGELKDRLKEGETGEVPKGTLIMAVELADREDYRDVIAASLEEKVDREANALVHEMAEILAKQRSITKHRQEDLFERVRKLGGAVREYEGLLEREISDARANLELARSEAVSLLSKVEVSDVPLHLTNQGDEEGRRLSGRALPGRGPRRARILAGGFGRLRLSAPAAVRVRAASAAAFAGVSPLISQPPSITLSRHTYKERPTTSEEPEPVMNDEQQAPGPEGPAGGYEATGCAEELPQVLFPAAQDRRDLSVPRRTARYRLRSVMLKEAGLLRVHIPH